VPSKPECLRTRTASSQKPPASDHPGSSSSAESADSRLPSSDCPVHDLPGARGRTVRNSRSSAHSASRPALLHSDEGVWSAGPCLRPASNFPMNDQLRPRPTVHRPDVRVRREGPEHGVVSAMRRAARSVIEQRRARNPSPSSMQRANTPCKTASGRMYGLPSAFGKFSASFETISGPMHPSTLYDVAAREGIVETFDSLQTRARRKLLFLPSRRGCSWTDAAAVSRGLCGYEIGVRLLER
jgi:hypothetical protein